MRTRTIMLALAVCFMAVALCFAGNPNLGTWKLNEAKSKMAAGAPKNDTVVYEAVGDNIKATVDGRDGEGKPIHSEWTGKFDGKEYPLVGDATADSRSYKTINERTIELTNMKAGKVTTKGKIVVSADGKTRTIAVTGTDAMGKKFSYTAAYDKQ